MKLNEINVSIMIVNFDNFLNTFILIYINLDFYFSSTKIQKYMDGMIKIPQSEINMEIL